MNYKGKSIVGSPKFTFVSNESSAGKRALKLALADRIEQFIDAKRIARRSPKTLKAYRQVLDQFRKWYDETGHTEITSDILRSYIDYLTFTKAKWDDHPTNPTQGAGLSPRTVNNTIRNMRIFFNYLVDERLISYNPMESVAYQAEPKDTFEIFTDEEVVALLSGPNRRTYTGRRDYCMMLVLCDCGLRISELIGLHVADVNLKLRQIIVRAETSKSNAMRVVPISPLTARELENLMAYMEVGDNDPLWLTQFGERYFGDTFAKMLKIYARRAGVVGPRVSAHTFRHYFAVKYLREGGELISLMRILGHSSPAMTEKYVKYSAMDLGRLHRESSPVMSLELPKAFKTTRKVRFK